MNVLVCELTQHYYFDHILLHCGGAKLQTAGGLATPPAFTLRRPVAPPPLVAIIQSVSSPRTLIQLF